MTSAFIDEFPHLLRNKKVLFTAGMCFVEFVLGIPCVFQVIRTLLFLQTAVALRDSVNNFSLFRGNQLAPSLLQTHFKYCFFLFSSWESTHTVTA